MFCAEVSARTGKEAADKLCAIGRVRVKRYGVMNGPILKKHFCHAGVVISEITNCGVRSEDCPIEFETPVGPDLDVSVFARRLE